MTSINPFSFLSLKWTEIIGLESSGLSWDWWGCMCLWSRPFWRLGSWQSMWARFRRQLGRFELRNSFSCFLQNSWSTRRRLGFVKSVGEFAPTYEMNLREDGIMLKLRRREVSSIGSDNCESVQTNKQMVRGWWEAPSHFIQSALEACK